MVVLLDRRIQVVVVRERGRHEAAVVGLAGASHDVLKAELCRVQLSKAYRGCLLLGRILLLRGVGSEQHGVVVVLFKTHLGLRISVVNHWDTPRAHV